MNWEHRYFVAAVLCLLYSLMLRRFTARRPPLKSRPSSQHYPGSRTMSDNFHLPAVLFGVSLILMGLGLQYYSGFGFDLLVGFLWATGVQILLWCIGVRVELLGNAPAVIETSRRKRSARLHTL